MNTAKIPLKCHDALFGRGDVVSREKMQKEAEDGVHIRTEKSTRRVGYRWSGIDRRIKAPYPRPHRVVYFVPFDWFPAHRH